jgi:hypothetical protein
MSTTLKQANRGCFLLTGAFIASLLSAAGLFMLFAMGMSGAGLNEGQRDLANGIFIVLVIVTPLACLVTPLAGIWGFVLVVMSTIKEIAEDRKLAQASEGPAPVEGFKVGFGRVRQAAAIGMGLFAVFYIVAIILLNILNGDVFSFTALLGLPLMVVLGSIGGGILYARRVGRETAVSTGALIGGAVMGLLGIVGFVVFLVSR